jgi:hypothetical protein
MHNMMVEELDDILPGFSPVNRTRCFSHILNLVAKSLLKQFDITKDEKKNNELNDDEQSLLALAEGLEDEELLTAQEMDDGDNKTEDNDDDISDWIDEAEVLMPEEQENLEDSV